MTDADVNWAKDQMENAANRVEAAISENDNEDEHAVAVVDFLHRGLLFLGECILEVGRAGAPK